MASASRGNRPRLTVGMACFDDFNGVYFTVQALQIYHAEVLDQIEFIVVDNNPEGEDGKAVKNLLTAWIPHARYIAAPDVVGTAAPRNLVFDEARGEAVLCLDCHVLLEAGSVRRLIDYYAAHPESCDLLHGPLLNDGCKPYATHMEPVWRDEMFGIWGLDSRGLSADQPEFEIPMHGCGLMSCRKEAWLGFHRQFRGFGGEEGYIHEKYRQAGYRALCLPWLRWLHRFGRPAGIAYPLTLNDRVRNYILGRLELGKSYDDVLEHFAPRMDQAALDCVLFELQLPSLLDHWFPDRKRPPLATKSRKGSHSRPRKNRVST